MSSSSMRAAAGLVSWSFEKKLTSLLRKLGWTTRWLRAGSPSSSSLEYPSNSRADSLRYVSPFIKSYSKKITPLLETMSRIRSAGKCPGAGLGGDRRTNEAFSFSLSRLRTEDMFCNRPRPLGDWPKESEVQGMVVRHCVHLRSPLQPRPGGERDHVRAQTRTSLGGKRGKGRAGLGLALRRLVRRF